MFGALLIQVLKGNQFDGVNAVGNIAEVAAYINEVAPPVIFTARSPEIVSVNPSVTLSAQEDTQANRERAELRMKTYMQTMAKPGALITAVALKTAVVDGAAVTDAAVKIGDSVIGSVHTTILQYPFIGKVLDHSFFPNISLPFYKRRVFTDGLNALFWIIFSRGQIRILSLKRQSERL